MIPEAVAECEFHKRRAAAAEAQLAARDADVEEFWREVALGYDIEPRQFFEDNAVKDGWSSPIAMALHHIWKRDAKVKNLLDDVARLTEERNTYRDTCARWLR